MKIKSAIPESIEQELSLSPSSFEDYSPQVAEQFETVEPLIVLTPNTFEHAKFTEHENPLAALEAQRVHAEGYVTTGFVTVEAIDSDGRLSHEIDKSRGEHTDYYLALHKSDERNIATLRMINTPEDGTISELPAFRLSSNNLNETGRTVIGELIGEGYSFREIAALAKTEHGNPMGIHELFRVILHEAIEKKEAWIFTIVSSTYASLVESFGDSNFIIIGEDVRIDDPRVNKDITLKPGIMVPDRFIDNLYAAYAASEGKQKRRLQRSFLFFTDGLNQRHMSQEAYAARREMTKLIEKRKNEYGTN